MSGYYRRRVPREPEASHEERRPVRLDPPSTSEPIISLSESQMQLAERRRQRHQPPPTVAARDPSEVGRPFWPQPEITGTPSRTPNPVSRSDVSSSRHKPSSPNYLRSLLSKSASFASKDDDDGRRSMKNVLAKRLSRKSPKAARTAPPRRTEKVAENPMAGSVRDKLRKMRMTPVKAVKPDEPAALQAALTTRLSEHPALKKKTEPPKPKALPPKPESMRAKKQDLELYKDMVEASRSADSRSLQIAPSDDSYRGRYLSGADRAPQPLESKDRLLSQQLTLRLLGKSESTSLESATVEEEEETDAEFLAFLQGLQAETLGAHSQLWASFQAILTGQAVPVNHVVRSTEKFEYDKKTAATARKVNEYLIKAGLRRKDSKPQLVSDRKFIKEVKDHLPSLGPSSTEEEEADAIAENRSSSTLGTADKQPGLSRPPRRPGAANGFDATQQRDLIMSTRSESTDEDRKEHRTMRALTDTWSGSTDEPSTVSHNDQEKKSNAGMEVVLGQKPSADTSSTASSLPWAGLDLRNSSSVATIEPSPASSLGSQPEWANFKLRKTKKDDDDSSELSEMGKLQQTTTAITEKPTTSFSFSEESLSLRMSEPTLSPIPPPPPPPPPPLPPKQRTDVVDKEVVPIGIGSQQDKNSKMVPLKHVAGLGKDESAQVLIGKEWLMVVKHGQSSQVGTVLWKHERQSIGSFAMDMASFQVTLTVEKVKRVLFFKDADSCMAFVNGMHATSRDEPPEPTVELTVEPRVTERVKMLTPVKETLSSADSVQMDSLSQEEQTLLETYRRLRREKGAEEALNESLPMAKSEDLLSLSLSQEAIAQIYKKMIKMGTSLEEVEKKMQRDGVDERIIATVVADAPPRIVSADEHPTSPVSAMSGSVGLSVSEAELAESYMKMLRLRIDPEAVRHKMVKDRVDPKVMAMVFSSSEASVATTTSAPTLTEKEQETADSYRKMVKLGFPEEVIRHRMQKEQVDDKIVAAVFGNDVAAAVDTKTAPSDKLTEEEESIASGYRKMLKMGIEKEAVRHKMTKDQVSARLINAVLGSDDGTVAEAPSVSTMSMPAPTGKKALGSSLSEEEESVATGYRKMLKLQIPKQQVVIRMQQDGVSSKIITAVVGTQAAQHEAPDDSKDRGGTGSKLVSLHWTPLSGEALDNSIWRVNSKLEDDDVQPAKSDINNLISLFQKKATVSRGTSKKSDDDSTATGMAKILDITRSNNVSISLKAFKDFSFEELAQIIAFLDPLRKISGERVLFLRGLLPNVNELKSIRDYHGPNDRLVPAERWFRQICKVKRLESKVQVLQTMETFQSGVDTVADNLRLLSQVCNDVMDSEKLQALLYIVLRIGNIMNEGTRTGGASGFKFDSLVRLTQTKSSDGKMTVLDFIVDLLVRKGQRSVLEIHEDFPKCHDASRIVIGDLLSEVKELRDSLNKCQLELDRLKDDSSGKSSRAKMGGDATSSAATDPKAALLAAISSRAGLPPSANPSTKTSGFTKREEFLAALKQKTEAPPPPPPPVGKLPIVGTGDARRRLAPFSSNSEQAEEQADETKCSIEAGIKRLEQFVASGHVRLESLEATRSKAVVACKDLSKYCGESSGTSATSHLLGILAEFATNITDALKKYDNAKKAEARRARKKGDDNSTHCSEETPMSSAQKADNDKSGSSLVLMVHDVLKAANERTKEDFRKGRVYPDASSKLKAIYEREQKPPLGGSPGAKPRRSDIVSAMKEQEGSLNPDELQQMRSQFGEVRKPAHTETTVTARADAGTSQANLFGVKTAAAMFEGLMNYPSTATKSSIVSKAASSEVSVAAAPATDGGITIPAAATTAAQTEPKQEYFPPATPPRTVTNTSSTEEKPLSGVKQARAIFETMASQSPSRPVVPRSLSGSFGLPSYHDSQTIKEEPNGSSSELDAAAEPLSTESSAEVESPAENGGDQADSAVDLPITSGNEPTLARDETAATLVAAHECTVEDADAEQVPVSAVKDAIAMNDEAKPSTDADGKRSELQVQKAETPERVFKLSDARKARSKMESLLSRPSPPLTGKSKPRTSDSPAKTTTETQADSRFDTSASKDRLKERQGQATSIEPNTVGASTINVEKMSSDVSLLPNPSTDESVAAEPMVPSPAPLPPTSTPRIDDATISKSVSSEKKSLAELAREKRVAKSTPTKVAGLSPERSALSEVPIPNKQRESPVLQKARQMREEHNKSAEKAKAPTEPLLIKSPPTADRPSFADLARKKREEKRKSSGST